MKGGRKEREVEKDGKENEGRNGWRGEGSNGERREVMERGVK